MHSECCVHVRTAWIAKLEFGVWLNISWTIDLQTLNRRQSDAKALFAFFDEFIIFTLFQSLTLKYHNEFTRVFFPNQNCVQCQWEIFFSHTLFELFIIVGVYLNAFAQIENNFHAMLYSKVNYRSSRDFDLLDIFLFVNLISATCTCCDQVINDLICCEKKRIDI